MTLVCRRRRHLDTCVNDDSTSDEFGDTCSGWYDNNDNCSGDYDDSDFSSNVQCCKCGGSKRCDIVVSGSSNQDSKHGTYEQSGLPRTVNGTGHTGPSEFCATSI